MRGFAPPVLFAALTLVFFVLPQRGGCSDDHISFNRDVRPLLSDSCFFCHGPDSAHREADLRLDVESIAKEHAIVPGQSDASELIARILSDDPNTLMPPPESGKRLTKKQKELLVRWVQQGAVYETYWAYANPKPHKVPAHKNDWSRDPVDQFLIDALPDSIAKPSPEAQPHTLLRRVTFDLTGLPPTPQQVKAFTSDPSPLAYRKLVDQLLASPAYGERMAVYWLDLVRYADTVGYHGDQDHNISPYRDYVIDSLNDDLPFDQFTREQLAGDLLPDPSVSQMIATGYNRLLQTSHEGGVQPKEYLAIYAADRIRNLSAVWMGATVGCAQCHDHKYDPYSLRDFYSMSAFFADIDEQQHFKVGTNSLPTKRPPEISVLNRWQRDLHADVEAEISVLEQTSEPDTETSPRLAVLLALRDQLQSSAQMTMVTKTIEPRPVRVLPRGNWLDESGPLVEPAIPEFLGRLETPDRATRLDLADWLVNVEEGAGGLTARVLVNRLWYLLFGRGISSSLGDFGGQGQPPSHPELLDQLTIDFIADDWSIKRLMRRLVLSSAYRQSSVATDEQRRIDPYNQWFARQSRYRLPAEMVRDTALAMSDLLVTEVGGNSIKPSQPAGYYRHLNFPKRLYTPDRDAKQFRRGVYVHWQRQFLHPMLKALDAPSREECTAQRPRSNTPLEALVMLNDPAMVDAAISLASRLITEVDSTEDRIDRAFVITLSRKPDSFERKTVKRLLQGELDYYRSQPQDAKDLLESADRSINVTIASPEQLAAWTSVARLVLNLQETVTRN